MEEGAQPLLYSACWSTRVTNRHPTVHSRYGRPVEHSDVVVIGAGFGGLSAALHLAEAGHKVVLCEALTYPGGCASTFTKDGYRFEAGATLFSGFGPGQWMARWIDRFQLDVRVDPVDPVFTFHGPAVMDVPSDRTAFADQLCALPNAPVQQIRAWMAYQERIGDVLWGVLDEPDLLPPWSLSALWRHALRAPSYLRLLPLVNRPMSHALERFGVADFAPLRSFLDAACQITVQVPASEAEATFAIGAVENFFRGAAHIHGGVGELGSAVCGAIERMGGSVRFANRVKALEPSANGWTVQTRGGPIQARHVVANQLPHDLSSLANVSSARLSRMRSAVDGGWGAAMLYMVVKDEGLPAHAVHHELVEDAQRPLPGGNHVLVSIAARDDRRAPVGFRTASASTHVHPNSDHPARTLAAVQERMRVNISRKLPQLQVVEEYTASPRTFERFTRRKDGLVGGIPRRVGLHNYAGLWPRPVARGLWLVGDSAFPGQSVLSVAIGGYRVASAIGKHR